MRAARAIAFDLDGTLVDSRRDIIAACNFALRAVGRAPLEGSLITRFVGDGAHALVARALALPRGDAIVDEAAKAFVDYYAQHPADETTWMPGALEVLDALEAWPLALVTNKARPVALRLLEALGAAGRFAFVYAGGDGPLKPGPEPMAAVAGALRVDVRDVWMVGDGHQDVLAARAAGAQAVAVLGGLGVRERIEEARPDAMLESLHELPDLIQRAAS